MSINSKCLFHLGSCYMKSSGRVNTTEQGACLKILSTVEVKRLNSPSHIKRGRVIDARFNLNCLYYAALKMPTSLLIISRLSWM